MSAEDKEVERQIAADNNNSKGNESNALLKSWVFVEAKPDSSPDSVNKFYLNCSEEPVQELHEHDLGTLNSEVESDTDEISIISETDPRYEKSDEENGTLSNKSESEDSLYSFSKTIEKDNVLENAERTHHQILMIKNAAKLCCKKGYEFNSFLLWLFGFAVLGAGISCILDEIYMKDSNTMDARNPSMTVNDDINYMKESNNVVSSDFKLHCTELHNEDGIFKEQNIKQCIKQLKRELRNSKKVIEKEGTNFSPNLLKKKKHIKDESLENKNITENLYEPSSDSIQEIELNYQSQYKKSGDKENKQEMYFKKVKYRKKGDKEYRYEENKSKHKSEKKWKIDRHEYSENPNNKTKEEEKLQLEKQNLSKIIREHHEKEKELNAKEKYLREKEEYLVRKENELKRLETLTTINQDENKGKEDSEKQKKIMKENTAKNDKIFEKVSSGRKVDREKSFENKYDKIKKIVIAAENNIANKMNKYFQNRRKIKDGRWFMTLFEERKNMRKKEQESEWMFDRAKDRSFRRKIRSINT